MAFAFLGQGREGTKWRSEVRTAHPEVAISDPPGQMSMLKAFNGDLYRIFQVSTLEYAATVTDTNFGLPGNTRHAIAIAVLFL